MSNYEIIKAACQKANPKLMELSFGCVLRRQDGVKDVETIIYKRENRGNAAHDYLSTTGGQIFVEAIYSDAQRQIKSGYITQNNFAADIWEILGHEPNLQDVLLAIYKKLEDEDQKFVMEIKTMDLMQRFDLSKSVQDQDEQTLKFIADLL